MAEKSITELAEGMAHEIARVLTQNGYRGDFSLASLRDIDRLIDEHSDDRVAVEGGFFDPPNLPPDRRIPTRLVALGCYVGEVLIRAYGGEWHGESDELNLRTLIQLQVRLGTWTVHPVSKVFKRLENGPEDSVEAFGQFAATIAAETSPAEDKARQTTVEAQLQHGGGEYHPRRVVCLTVVPSFDRADYQISSAAEAKVIKLVQGLGPNCRVSKFQWLVATREACGAIIQDLGHEGVENVFVYSAGRDRLEILLQAAGQD